MIHLGKLERTASIRIPSAMFETIKRMADEDYRTFNSQVNILLHDALKKTRLQDIYEKVDHIEKLLEGKNEREHKRDREKGIG